MLTLDDFLAVAPTTLALFAARTRELGRTDPGMSPSLPRDEAWWWRDVAAFLDYTELEELVKQRGRGHGR